MADPGDIFGILAADRADKRAERGEYRFEAEQRNALEALTPSAAITSEGKALDIGVPTIPTGWRRLDEKVGGLAIPSLNVLGAAPKSGKSTWAQIIALRHIANGGAVYHLDLENGRRRYYRRLLCRACKIGPSEISYAFKNPNAPDSEDKIKKWLTMKVEIQARVTSLFTEFTPLTEYALEQRLIEVKSRIGNRKFLVVIDSLQKLPGGLDDRRATVDKWVRLFERLRIDLDAAILVISEIRRNGKGEYVAHEASFKESGGIEYAADLAMTLTRPRADEKNKEPISTLRVELARDSDRDPRGVIAGYSPTRPYYGLEEIDPPKKNGKPSEGGGEGDEIGLQEWLEDRLMDGPVRFNTILDEATKLGFTRPTLQRMADKLKIKKSRTEGWRLP